MGAIWGGDIHREHPGKIFTPCEPSRECILPEGGPWGPLGLGPTPKGSVPAKNHGTPTRGGANTAARRLLQRVGPPHGPPLTLGGSFLGSFTSKFTNNLGWIG